MSSWIPFHGALGDLVDANEGSYVLAAVSKGEVGASVCATEAGIDIPVQMDDCKSNLSTIMAIAC